MINFEIICKYNVRFLPRVSAFMVKIMKPMALFLIVFILGKFYIIQCDPTKDETARTYKLKT